MVLSVEEFAFHENRGWSLSIYLSIYLSIFLSLSPQVLLPHHHRRARESPLISVRFGVPCNVWHSPFPHQRKSLLFTTIGNPRTCPRKPADVMSEVCCAMQWVRTLNGPSLSSEACLYWYGPWTSRLFLPRRARPGSIPIHAMLGIHPFHISC